MIRRAYLDSPEPTPCRRANTEYTTTKTGITIGIAAIPRPPREWTDMEQIQTALLERRTESPRPIAARLIGAVVRWL